MYKLYSVCKQKNIEMMISATPLQAVVLFAVIHMVDGCKNYTVLSEADRAQGNAVKIDSCDGDLVTGWYRFQGAPGDRMPDTCVLQYRCGTESPGWLNGTHPTVAEGVVTRKVCYHAWRTYGGLADCCRYSNNIKVKNCSGYFVYELQKPPNCPLRYCGNAGAVDGCKNYTVLSEADRAQGNAVANNSCDGDLVTGWYRFQGAAGDRMPDTCVLQYRCGIMAPGWLNGAHPTVAEGVVTRKVCYSFWDDCCYWSNNIKVQNCGGYFVYELQRPPGYYLRYCGNAGAVDGCKNYTVLSEADRAQGNAVNNDSCDRYLVTGWYRFQGAAGDRMPDTCVLQYRCGTVAPGWLNGAHPTVAEGAVTRQVCYRAADRCCDERNIIKVQNCGGYFVYELQRMPFFGCFRYCGNAGAVMFTQTGSFTATTATGESSITSQTQAPLPATSPTPSLNLTAARNSSMTRLIINTLSITPSRTTLSQLPLASSVSQGDLLEISLQCIINCKDKISPSVKLSIQSQCQGPQCSKISTYKWILYQQYPSAPYNGTIWKEKELKHIIVTPHNSSSIVIKKNSLEGGSSYRLVLQIKTSDGKTGMSVYYISTASPPTGGICSITPSSGISLETNFSLSCSNWTSDSPPLSYKFQFQLENGLHTIIYSLNSTINSWMPPGNQSQNFAVKFVGTVTDKYGASAPAVNLSVQVKPSQLLRPENVTKFLSANNSLFRYAIKDGDLSKAAQIANAVLQAVLHDTAMDSDQKSKVQDFIIKSTLSLQVKSIPDLLQSSSVIGSALRETQTVSSKSLVGEYSA
ncbi:hypothetical protein ACROYT_G025275 [Oculina patagonica]